MYLDIKILDVNINRMDDLICSACGVQRRVASPDQPCPICQDERQYLPEGGQKWLSPEALSGHGNTFTEVEPGLVSIRTAPAFGIGHRAFLVTTPEGNVLWDCLSVIDDATVAAIRARGGLAAIAISHPHFYG